jgi:uncharacterized OB-fold protein
MNSNAPLPVSLMPPTTHFHLETDRWSAPFWKATAEHRLQIPRCGACERFRMPPSAFCPACQSQAVDWVTVEGTGTVYSYTIITNAPFAEAAAHVPYVPALIELDGAPGVRLVSAVVGAPLAQVAIGAKVALSWQDLAEGISVPRFTLVEAA